MTSDRRHSGELWVGGTIRYENFVLFGVRVIPAMTVGLSFASSSIGVERGREIGHNGNARVLGYLAPEIAFAFVDRPNVELVVRLHHRSGANGAFNGMHEGYNANVLGLRVYF